MAVNTYEDMRVELMHHTPYPAEVVAQSLAITMHKDEEYVPPSFSYKLGQYLLDAEHPNPLEHVSYNFLVQGVSRSFLAQITRHGSHHFTSGSQHYQDYSDYDAYISGTVIKEIPVSEMIFTTAIMNSLHSYAELIKVGVKPEEARQVLPNAMGVNLYWTMNLRDLVFFLRPRLCNRNVEEMKVFAQRVLSLVEGTFPEVFAFVGPQCHMGECKQGKLRCKEKTWKRFSSE